jgi:hypothetical protein
MNSNEKKCLWVTGRTVKHAAVQTIHSCQRRPFGNRRADKNASTLDAILSTSPGFGSLTRFDKEVRGPTVTTDKSHTV